MDHELDPIKSLRQTWNALCETHSRPPGLIEGFFQELAALYSAPPRFYHTLSHLEFCFRELPRDNPVVQARSEELTAAVFYHDAVYEARRSDNEEASAQLAGERLRALGFPLPFRQTVHGLILATRHPSAPRTEAEALLADVDLAILGQPPDAYNAYAAAVRREFQAFDDAAYNAGRLRVLQHFLRAPTLYRTPFFQRKYTRRARENITRELHKIELHKSENILK